MNTKLCPFLKPLFTMLEHLNRKRLISWPFPVKPFIRKSCPLTCYGQLREQHKIFFSQPRPQICSQPFGTKLFLQFFVNFCICSIFYYAFVFCLFLVLKLTFLMFVLHHLCIDYFFNSGLFLKNLKVLLKTMLLISVEPPYI